MIGGSMKKLFIYFSMTGNGDFVAKYYKDHNYDIRKVITKKRYPKHKFFMMMKGGFRAGFGLKDKLIDFDKSVDSYKEIVIGSPIWFDRLSPAINSVLNQINIEDKKVTFVLYSASGVANKATEKINKLYKGKVIILKEPKKNKEEIKKL